MISPTPSIFFGFLIVENRYGFWGTYMEDLMQCNYQMGWQLRVHTLNP